MSKDLAIAGVIVLSCLTVTAVAFINPNKETSADDAETVSQPIQPSERAPSVLHEPVTEPAQPWNTTSSPFPLNSDPAPASPWTPDPIVEQLPPPTPTPVDVPPALPQTQPISTPQTHVVAQGEMLGDISLKYYGTTRHWRKIAEANKIDPNYLLVGQKIDIPVIEAAPTAQPSTPVQSGVAGESRYIVKEGDSYYRIAQKELGDPSRYKEIEQLNKIAPEDLRVGQAILLPNRAPTEAAPASSSSSSPVSDGSETYHTVASGEMLGDISTRYYGTSKRWREIVQANPGLDPERLYVGKKILIPNAKSGTAANASSTTSSGASATTPDKESVQYTVKSGDNLESIAKEFYGNGKDWPKIQKANPGLDPGHLRIGQKITIPDAKSATVSQPIPAPMPTPTFTAPAPKSETSPFAPPSDPVAPSPWTNEPKPSDSPFAPPAATPPERQTGRSDDDIFKEFLGK